MAAEVVSVCVPVYNGARYLSRALESIAAQTYPALEILLVDDGSTDTSVEMLRAYAAADPRATVHVNEKNAGLTGNWNRCVELATGEWVKFVFQDDWLEPSAVETMVRHGAHGSDLVVAARRYEYQPGVAEGLRSRLDWLLAESRSYLGDRPRHLSVDEVADALACWGNWNFLGEPVAVMLRRSALLRTGPFSGRFLVISDYLYWLRLAMSSGLTWVPDVLSGFLVHSSSVSGEHRDTYAVQQLEAAGFFATLVHDPDFSPFVERLTRLGERRSYRSAADYLIADAHHEALRLARAGLPQTLETWRRHVQDPANSRLLAASRVERLATVHRLRRAWGRALLRSDRHLRVLRPIDYPEDPPSAVRHYAARALRRFRCGL